MLTVEDRLNKYVDRRSENECWPWTGHTVRGYGQLRADSSGIEFCDVFSDEGELIHVKRESRSATLSHLFAQGTVSALTFINDDEYRTELRGLINQTVPQDSSDKWLNLIPPAGNTVERSKYRVTYAVITDSKREGRNWLPFFSKLNLMQHAKQLVSSGFEVAVARVPIADR